MGFFEKKITQLLKSEHENHNRRQFLSIEWLVVGALHSVSELIQKQLLCASIREKYFYLFIYIYYLFK